MLDEWDVNGTKVGIDIQGLLNDPKDIDNGWSIELAIPIKYNAIDRGHSFGEGSMWRVNFRVYSGNIKLPATGMKKDR